MTYKLDDFDNKTPTYMAATHAISKSERNFQKRIPRELENFVYPQIRLDWLNHFQYSDIKKLPIL